MKRAFTLLELILVVVIVGVVYMFAIGSLEKFKAKSDNTLVTLPSLKAFLLAKDFDKEARFVCFDGCSRCSVLLDGNISQEINDFFDSAPKTYRYTQNLGMENIQSDPYFDENGIQKDVCFSYRIYKEGIGDQILVEYHNKVYDYSDYFEDVKVYDSIESAKISKEAVLQRVLL